MPTYVYRVVRPTGAGEAGPEETLEVRQSMSDPPLTRHPETGEPVRRVFGTPNAPRTWTDAHAKGKTSDKSLEGLGFTKYVKGERGYQKQFGKGPDVMKKPPQG